MEKNEITNYKKAGEICAKVKAFAREIIKKDMPLLEIAEKIEAKIGALGGKPAFPVNLSINEVAAHYTPTFNDSTKAHGLLKVDIGVHVEGFVADSAFSIELDGNSESKMLIEAAEKGLEAGIDAVVVGKKIGDAGGDIEKAIKSKGAQPIVNLSGHSIDEYDLHSGLTVPNVFVSSDSKFEEGAFAVEPFATLNSGSGAVRDGAGSGIFSLIREGNVRDIFAREVLGFIVEEYQTLPFCSRWIHKKFGTRGLVALRQIEQAGLLHQYPQLIEKSGKLVAQAEHTVILTGKEKIVSTK